MTTPSSFASFDIAVSKFNFSNFSKNAKDINNDNESDSDDGDGGFDCGDGYHYNVLMLALFVIGTIGNVASVIVMRRPQLARRSGSPALQVLVFVNTFGLFCNALQCIDDINSTYHSSIESHIGPIGCKLWRFIPAVVQLMGHWVVVYITAQRYVAICRPSLTVAFFNDANAKPVFTCILLVVAATQLWRPYLDTQEPATYRNSSEGILELVSPAMCTAKQLGIYIEIESFFYQLGLLFFIPAVLIAVMNTCVIMRLYQDNAFARRQAVRRSIRSLRHSSVKATNSNSSTNKMRQSRQSIAVRQSFLEELENIAGARPVEEKLRKATIVLLAVTCTFWLYIMPHLFLLLYVRLSELIYGRMAGFTAFFKVCKALNVTSFVATITNADYFIIQLIFDEMFRWELKFYLYEVFGHCSIHCQYLYIKERQKLRRRRIASRAFLSNTDDIDEHLETDEDRGELKGPVMSCPSQRRMSPKTVLIRKSTRSYSSPVHNQDDQQQQDQLETESLPPCLPPECMSAIFTSESPNTEVKREKKPPLPDDSEELASPSTISTSSPPIFVVQMETST